MSALTFAAILSVGSYGLGGTVGFLAGWFSCKARAAKAER